MVCNNFHLVPPGYFHSKIIWKSTKAKKNPQNPQALGFIINSLFKKECHLLSDKLESMEICLRVNDSLYIPVHYTYHVPGRISTTQRKLYSSNTYCRRQNWIVRQMNYPLLVRFIWLLLYYTVYPPKTELLYKYFWFEKAV